MTSPDELADAMWRASFPVTADRFEPLTEKGLHHLARDAAKQALLDAAADFAKYADGHWEGAGVVRRLQWFAEQIGETE